MTLLVILLTHREAVGRLMRVLVLPHVTRVRCNNSRNLLENGGEFLVSAKDEYRRFRVTPLRIPEDLIDGLGQNFGSAPELALSDEQILVGVPDEDVGLSFVVEGLASGLSFELPIQR